jgi:hypothetical protein
MWGILDPPSMCCGLSSSECILDSIGEWEAKILATKGAPEVIHVQGPHHGTCQLPVFQVLHLVGRTREGRAGFSGTEEGTAGT